MFRPAPREAIPEGSRSRRFHRFRVSTQPRPIAAGLLFGMLYGFITDTGHSLGCDAAPMNEQD